MADICHRVERQCECSEATPLFGTVAFLTMLTTAVDGIICPDWETLNIGTSVPHRHRPNARASCLALVPIKLWDLRGGRPWMILDPQDATDLCLRLMGTTVTLL